MNYKRLRKLVKSILSSFYEKTTLIMYLGVAGGRRKTTQIPVKQIKDVYGVSCRLGSIFGYQYTVEQYCYLLKLFCIMSSVKAVHGVI